MLTSVGIGNFKSYESALLKLSPLTVLIGANASGKSNAIEALRLLSWVASGNRLASIKYAVYEGDQAVRGTVANLGYRGRKNFSLYCQVYPGPWDRFKIELEVGEDDDLHIVHESIKGQGTSVPLYEVVSRTGELGSDLRVAYNNFARGGRKPQVQCNDHVAILTQLQSSARFEAGHRAAQNMIPRVCTDFQEQLSSILFLDPQPSKMREYSFTTENQLLGDGRNLSGVLYNLCRQSDEKDNVLGFVKSLPEQNISAIDFVETPRGEVMVKLEENFGGFEKQFDATLLSDGTLRVLSIAAAILSAAPGTLVVIEEIDNGVHPSRAEEILDSISKIAKDRKLRVLISSHNPALLNALPDDAIPNVVFCFRDPDNGSSKLIRLSDAPDYPKLVAQGALGNLLTDGIIDRFVKGHSGPHRRREAARSWAEEFKAKVA